jgi:hypothetical protein
MLIPNPEQSTLFETAELKDRTQVPSGFPEMTARSSGPELTGSSPAESRPKEPRPLKAVSPFANLPLHEACAFCGTEVRPPGFVILDFEELGVFCNEECGDKRFRLYLNDRDEEIGAEYADRGPSVVVGEKIKKEEPK